MNRLNERRVARLRGINFSESLVDEVVRVAGGHRIMELISLIPPSIKNCDYWINNHLLDLKIIEKEPLEVPNHQNKLTELFKTLPQRSDNDSMAKDQIHLTGEANIEYWKIVGVRVRRILEKGADQIRDTKRLLNRSDLRGSIFLINSGADSIDPTSLWNLACHHRRYFSDQVDSVMCFSAIPGVVEGLNRPCIMFEYDPSGETADRKFAEHFKEAFHSVIANKLGKKLSELEAISPKVKPLRSPFTIQGHRGTFVIH